MQKPANKNGIVYRIYCTKTRKSYVGSTINECSRFAVHESILNNKKHTNKLLQDDFNKYGIEYFRIEILEIVKNKILIKREEFWFKKYEGKLYNICTTAGLKGNRLRRGTKFSKESKAKLSLSKIGNKNRLGILHTQEIKDKIGASLKKAYAEGRHKKPDIEMSKQNIKNYNNLKRKKK